MMKIAIPVENGLLNPHFGHCGQFALFDVDVDAQKIITIDTIDAPPHEPGLLPGWLGEKGVNVVVTGGMGQRAIQLCNDVNIDVIIGIAPEPPEVLVKLYLEGKLKKGSNACDH